MVLSKSRVRFIHSLELKKNRKAEKVFLAEGHKLVGDLLEERVPCRFLIATRKWLNEHPFLPVQDIIEVTEEELARASLLKTPQQVLAVFEQSEWCVDDNEVCRSLSIALDDVQDPGNLGTIIRLADWFGIEHIYCSLNTVDVYNPKVVQATMGAIARVKVHYVPLFEFISSLKNIPIYGTFLNGDNIYHQTLTPNGLIVMGNEGNGISSEIEELINRKLYIPNHPIGRKTSESLNVAIATAIACAEFRRQASFR